jgi:hypothetical protein
MTTSNNITTTKKSNSQLKRELLAHTIQAVKDLLKGFIESIKIAPKTGSCYIRVNTKEGMKKVRISDHKTSNTHDLDVNLCLNFRNKQSKKNAIKCLKSNLQLV